MWLRPYIVQIHTFSINSNYQFRSFSFFRPCCSTVNLPNNVTPIRMINGSGQRCHDIWLLQRQSRRHRVWLSKSLLDFVIELGICLERSKNYLFFLAQGLQGSANRRLCFSALKWFLEERDFPKSQLQIEDAFRATIHFNFAFKLVVGLGH
jgi:hypothetical protein